MSFDENIITELREANKRLSVENFNLENKLHEYEERMQQNIGKDTASLLLKIQRCKQKLSSMNIRKSGKNNFQNYSYYELEDITKPITDVLLEEGLASMFHFTDNIGCLQIVDCETGAYTRWTTSIKTSTRWQKSLENTSKKGDVGELMKGIQALQTYARRSLYLQALEIAEPNVIEQEGNTTKRSFVHKKKDAHIDEEAIILPKGMPSQLNDIFEQVRKDFGTKVPFTKKTILNKLRSMEKNGTITTTEYEQCYEMIQ